MFNEIPKNCRYGYARVSSKSQEDNSSLEAQKEEFIQQGVPKKNIRFEVGSAADTISERPVWKDSKDIEFVKQTMGHQNLDTTSAYVNQLSDQERQKRISLI